MEKKPNSQSFSSIIKANSPAIAKTAIGVFNAVVVIIALLMASDYFDEQLRARYDVAKDNFASTVNMTEKVAYGYLKSSQTFCDNWAEYISGHDMTIDEALDFLREINSDSDIMAHVVFYDTLKGLSTVSRDEGGTDFTVNYSNKDYEITTLLQEVENCEFAGAGAGVHPHITRAYINTINNMVSVGFCHDIQLRDENGGHFHALLIRVVPSYVLRERCVFPEYYEKAELSMMDIDGNYITRPDFFVTDDEKNFFDFLTNSNGLSKKETTAIRQDMLDDGIGTLELKNGNGQNAFYAYHRGEFNSDWLIVGCIAPSDMDVKPIDMTITIIAMLGFLLLIIIDGGYIIIMHTKLKDSIEETKKANMAKTQFMSTMSHDIRTPMNAIVGMTEIAKHHLDDKEHIADCLKKITLASNHLLTLINDMLDISRVESGKFTLNPIVFSLAELAGNLVNIVRPQIKEKDLQFEVHIHHIAHEYLYADELRINQIFINLLSNAVKYTPVGGKVTLDLEEQTPPDRLNTVRLVYTVADTGIGMSEEFMKEMYVSFSRAKDSRVDTIQGTGLGLAITKQMVDFLNGTIDVESKLGEGTKFVVTLDLPIAESAPSDGYVLPKMRILIADDDPVFLESAKDTINSLEIDADYASNGKEAIEMAAAKHKKGEDYPCIILDLKMPEMDGISATKEIRRKLGSEIPIILISSYDWTDIEEEASAAGANSFISKPMFRSTLYNKINELFNFSETGTQPDEDKGEDLKGLNLLVAEDNDINWEIISAMLTFCGITAVRAENGKVCVDTINDAPEGTFQAVLMDIQMPVMNGKEAAVNIRNSEHEYVRNVPIIAMTADAFAEDVRSCLDVGMNSHVAKPLDMKKLLGELRKAVRK